MLRPLGLAVSLALVSFAAPAADDLSTVSERSGFLKTGRYDEVVRLCQAFASAYAQKLRCQRFGETPEGRPMLALIASWDGVLDPAKARGSYAGAMGWPQFMPSSFRKWAVDGDADGHRDIWGNPADVIASVAYYFQQHGWQRGGEIRPQRAGSLAGGTSALRRRSSRSRTASPPSRSGTRSTSRSPRFRAT